MKKLWLLAILALFTLGLAACGGDDDDNGDDNGDDQQDVDTVLAAALEGIAANQTVYMTTVGQTEDVDILWNVFGQVFDSTAERGETITVDALLTADEVETGAVVLMVPGASSKGMGAAGTDQAAELVRANAFAVRAAAGEITLIMIHNGGMSRRGTLSDPLIEAAAKEALVMIVLTASNEDDYFNGLSTTHSVPLYVYSNNPSLVPPLKQLFDK